MQVSQTSSSFSDKTLCGWLTAFRYEQFKTDSLKRNEEELADIEKRSAKFAAEVKMMADSPGAIQGSMAASGAGDGGNSLGSAGVSAATPPSQTCISYA